MPARGVIRLLVPEESDEISGRTFRTRNLELVFLTRKLFDVLVTTLL